MSELNNEQSQGQDGHPAWQEILDKLPDDLHGIVKPSLEKWDQGVQKKLQDVHSQYDPYKDLIEKGVDPKYVEGALHLADQIRQNPEAVIEQANQAFNLGWTKEQQQAAANLNDPNDDDDPYGLNDEGSSQIDITKHPMVQQMAQQLQELQQGQQTREQAEAEAQAQAEYEAALEAAHKDTEGNPVEFNDLFVTALVSQGETLENAIKSYQSLVNTEVGRLTGDQKPQQNAPVVMGGSGNVGSGVPEQSVKMGSMSDGETQDLVLNILKQAEQQGNQ